MIIIISPGFICWSSYGGKSQKRSTASLPMWRHGPGNSLCSCYSLSNNGTIAHVPLTLRCALFFFPDCVFVHVVPLERSAAGISLFHSNYEISLHKNSDWYLKRPHFWSLKNNNTPMHYANAWLKTWKASMSPLKGVRKGGVVTLRRNARLLGVY